MHVSDHPFRPEIIPSRSIYSGTHQAIWKKAALNLLMLQLFSSLTCLEEHLSVDCSAIQNFLLKKDYTNPLRLLLRDVQFFDWKKMVLHIERHNDLITKRPDASGADASCYRTCPGTRQTQSDSTSFPLALTNAQRGKHLPKVQLDTKLMCCHLRQI